MANLVTRTLQLYRDAFSGHPREVWGPRLPHLSESNGHLGVALPVRLFNHPTPFFIKRGWFSGHGFWVGFLFRILARWKVDQKDRGEKCNRFELVVQRDIVHFAAIYGFFLGLFRADVSDCNLR